MNFVKLLYRASPESLKQVARALVPKHTRAFLYRTVSGSLNGYVLPAASKRKARQSPSDATRSWEEKLWNGFSTQAIDELNKIRADDRNQQIDKLHSAYTLMRWHVAERNYAAALAISRYMDMLTVSEQYRLRYDILKFECLLKEGGVEGAERIIQGAATITNLDHNYHLSLANLMLETYPSENIGRIEAINRVFRANNLVTIKASGGDQTLSLQKLEAYVCAPVEAPGRPLISVIMPAFNAEEYIEFAVLSILNQSWRNLELVVVDDASQDGTAAKVQAILATDCRVKLISLQENGGAYRARNIGLDAAEGAYITVHDADDWSHPQMLERQMEPFERDENRVATLSFLCRVDEKMRFLIRAYRPRLEYIHWNYSSLLFKSAVVQDIGKWDEVTAGGDSEFIDRIRSKFGRGAIAEVLPSAPLTFALTREDSATESRATSMRSSTYGGRREYAEQSQYWHSKKEFEISKLSRTSADSPFAVPNTLLPLGLKRDDRFDVVLISDLSLQGGTRRCNLAYLENLSAIGARVGMFHIPRLTNQPFKPVDVEYRSLLSRLNVVMLTHEDCITADLALMHFPPSLYQLPDALPQIEAKSALIVVNQLSRELYSGGPVIYEPAQIEENVREWLRIDPIWVPISGLTQRIMANGGYTNVQTAPWCPPLSDQSWLSRAVLWRGRERERPVIGRHGRDHWTKWPASRDEIHAAYCFDTSAPVQILGGTRAAEKIFGGKAPAHWVCHPFDSIDVRSFLQEVDIYVNFVNEDYIEEFGRNVMEAMAYGIPVVLDPKFEATFGTAAKYCSPSAVAAVVAELWADEDSYMRLANAGRAFVEVNCSPENVRQRFDKYLNIGQQGQAV